MWCQIEKLLIKKCGMFIRQETYKIRKVMWNMVPGKEKRLLKTIAVDNCSHLRNSKQYSFSFV